MSEVFDFLKNALPWIAIGIFVACSCVMERAKKAGNEMSGLFKGLSWSPAFCFLFVAVMEMLDGNTSDAATWLVLGVFNAVINFANTQKEEK